MANENDLHLYRASLSCYLSDIRIPHSAVLCSNMKCMDALHVSELNQYSADLTQACLSAGLASIPQTRNRKETGRIPGWSEEVEPLRQKSLFWHGIWIDCGRPRNGPVADCMRRTRATYHYAIHCVRKQEELIVRDRIAHSLLENGRRHFWAEVNKIRCKKAACCKIVDGYASEDSIAERFAHQYKHLCSSVPYDNNELRNIIDDVENSINSDAMYSECVVSCNDVYNAISKLAPHKNDGNYELSSDHIKQAGADLSVHIGFLLSAAISHGTVPSDFSVNTIGPIAYSQVEECKCEQQ